jgi:hypothetical protein
MLVGTWRKRNTPQLLVGLQDGKTIVENNLVVPQKIGHGTTQGPIETNPGCLHKRCSNIKQGSMLHYVHRSLIYNIQKLKRTQMPLNRRMDTENVVYLCNEVLLSY